MLDLPSHLEIHPFVHVIHMTPCKEQPAPERADPVPMVEGEEKLLLWHDSASVLKQAIKSIARR